MFQQINSHVLINLDRIDAIEVYAKDVTVHIGGNAYKSKLSEKDLIRLIGDQKVKSLQDISENIVFQTTNPSQFAGK